MNIFDDFENLSKIEEGVATGGLGYDQRIRVGKGQKVRLLFAGDIDDPTRSAKVLLWSHFATKSATNRSLSFMVHDLEQLQKNKVDPANPDVGLLIHNYGTDEWKKVFNKPTPRLYFLVFKVDKSGAVDTSTLCYLDAPKSMVQGILSVYQSRNAGAEKVTPLSEMVMDIEATGNGTTFKVNLVTTVKIAEDSEPITYNIQDNLAFLTGSPNSNEATVAMLQEQFPSVYEVYQEAYNAMLAETENKKAEVSNETPSSPETL